MVLENVTGPGETVHVSVEDSAGRWQTRRRFMIQVGIGFVTYMVDKPKKFACGDAVEVLLSLAEHHADAETLAYGFKQTQESTQKLLKLRAEF